MSYLPVNLLEGKPKIDFQDGNKPVIFYNRRIVILNSYLWEVAAPLCIVIYLNIFSDVYLLLANADQCKFKS